MKRINFIFFLAAVFTLSICFNSFSQVSSSQTAGGIVQQERLRDKSLSIKERIQAEKELKEKVIAEDQILDEEGPKVLVNQIEVEGATLIPQNVISSITSKFEGQQLSLKSMQKVADLITDEYRQRGYATSRAYIPPQTMKEGILIIRVVEGKMGSVQFRGNRYFKTSVLEKKMNLESSGYFDYSALQKSMVYINEHPDRQSRATLVPGREPGTTDIIIDVDDNYPFHAGFEYDNYGSRYIENERFGIVLEHNNLLGFDDKMYIKTLISDSRRLQMTMGRYIFPVSQTLDLGGYFIQSRTDLGEELEQLEAGGEAYIYGIFFVKDLIEQDDFDLRLNGGFDYKKIKNEIANVQSSRDELRVFKIGFDIDKIDSYGRNIFTAEMDFGVSDLLNGMADKDPNSSRSVGAGAKFQKSVFNYYRLQPMPYETSLLWKNSAQYTNHDLVASEQFQIGGPTSVRGYPPAEYSGDKGCYTSLEWSVPLYFISEYTKVPFRQERLYDALRLVFFYDLGFVNTKSLGAGERENQTLKGWGFGARLNVSSDFSLRAEIGYPSGKTPSDGDHAHPWVECIVKF